MFDEVLALLSKKYGKDVVTEIGKVFLDELRMWQREYDSQATEEAIDEAIEKGSILPLLYLKGAKQSLDVVEESIGESLQILARCKENCTTQNTETGGLSECIK